MNFLRFVSPDGLQQILFRPKGRMIYTGRFFYVLFDINADALMDAVQPIRGEVKKVHGALTKHLQKSTNQTVGQPYGVRTHSKSGSNHTNYAGKLTNPLQTEAQNILQQHIHFILTDLQEREQQIGDFIKTLHSYDIEPLGHSGGRREKRGLFNAGGELLQFIFGVATEDRVKSTEEILERLKSLGEESRKAINLHSRILNETGSAIIGLDKQVKKVAVCLQHILSAVDSLNSRNMELGVELTTANHILVLTNSLSYATTALMDLTTKFNSLKISLSRLRNGYLSPDIVSTDTVLSLVDNITKSNLRPIFPPAPNFLHALYECIKVINLPHSSLSFALAIPLTGDPGVMLDVFDVISLPHPVSADLAISFTNLPKFFAINEDRTLYAEMNTLDECRNFEDTFLCPISAPIYRENWKSCVFSHFVKEKTDQCHKHFCKMENRTQVIHTPVGWLYTAPNPVKIRISCPEDTRHLVIERGSGILKIPEYCKAISREFLIPASAKILKEEKLEIKVPIMQFKLNWTVEELEAIETMNSTPILKDVLLGVNNKLPLKSLKSDLKNLEQIQKWRKFNTVGGITSLTMSMMVVLISVILISLYCYYSRSLNRAPQTLHNLVTLQPLRTTINTPSNTPTDSTLTLRTHST